MGPWFGVIAGGTEFNFKHGMARNKNKRKRDKKDFGTTTITF